MLARLIARNRPARISRGARLEGQAGVLGGPFIHRQRLGKRGLPLEHDAQVIQRAAQIELGPGVCRVAMRPGPRAGAGP